MHISKWQLKASQYTSNRDHLFRSELYSELGGWEVQLFRGLQWDMNDFWVRSASCFISSHQQGSLLRLSEVFYGSFKGVAGKTKWAEDACREATMRLQTKLSAWCLSWVGRIFLKEDNLSGGFHNCLELSPIFTKNPLLWLPWGCC